MKTLYLPLLLVMSLTLISCKKEKPTGPFAGTKYSSLGKFDRNGRPDYLLPKDNISPGLKSFMSEYLVNGKNLVEAKPELFTGNAIADIPITKTATVYMTFVRQDAGRNNALAFYTYPSNDPPATAKDIKKIIYAFPNVGPNTTLTPGDKVSLGQFQPGISIGFVLLLNAWDNNKSTLNNGAIHFLTNDILNPETDPKLRKHAVLIPYSPENKVMIGFEDMNREDPACDHDFNDAVFYSTVVY